MSYTDLTVKDILTSSGKFPDRPKKWPPNAFQVGNAGELAARLNRLQTSFGKQLKLSSGYRPKAINDQWLKKGGSPDSWHLDAAAADIEDPKGILAKWVHDEEGLVAHFGLWMEKTNRDNGKPRGWVHFQIYPPASGERFFVGACRNSEAPRV